MLVWRVFFQEWKLCNLMVNNESFSSQEILIKLKLCDGNQALENLKGLVSLPVALSLVGKLVSKYCEV